MRAGVPGRWGRGSSTVVAVAVAVTALVPGGLEAQVRPDRAPTVAQPSPYALERSDELLLVGSGVALEVAAVLLERRLDVVSDADLQRTDAVPAFDRIATRRSSHGWRTASDVLIYGLGGAAAATGLALSDGSDERVAVFVVVAETALLTHGLTSVLKAGLGRTRPFAFNQGLTLAEKRSLSGDGKDARLSLPSGHTSGAFAAAVVIGTLHRDLTDGSAARDRAVWAGALSAAGLTGWARIEGGKHFPTDVLAGALLGTAVAWFVPWAHRAEGRPVVDVGPDGRGGTPLGVRVPLG